MKYDFKTKEDFEKHYRDIYNSGYDSGFMDGLKQALAYFLKMIDERFDDETVRDANYLSGQIGIAEWKRKQELYESLKKSAVEEYKKSLEGEKKTEE